MQNSRLTLNGLLALAATIAFQSCNPLDTDSTDSSGTQTSGCVIAIRAARSSCVDPAGGSTNPPPQPVATRSFQARVVPSDSSRVPDSVYVTSKGQVASAPKVSFNGPDWKVVITATFDQAVQVPDTVFVQAFKKSHRIATIKCLNQNLSTNTVGDWSIVSVERDSIPKMVGI